MKKLIVTLALGAALTAGALAPAVHAQSPAPAAPAGANASSANHARLQEAVEKLNLSGRQKLQCARILKSAKDSNQPKEQTLKQLEGVLNPQQMQQIKAAMAAQGKH